MLVVDSIMGSGKSTWAIKHVRENSDKKWLYVTPFLTEVERVGREAGIHTVVDAGEDKSKLAHARSLIAEQKSLVITHSLFVLLSKADLIKLSDYQIMIDEVLPVTKLIPIASSEIKLMFNEGFLKVVEEIKGAKKLSLTTPELYTKTKMAQFIRSYFEKGGELFLSDTNILAVLLPEFFFAKHERITVLTYMFEDTELDSYLDLKQVPITKKSVVNGELVDFNPETGERFKALINVINHKKMNEQEMNKSQRYTKAWYSRRSEKELVTVKNNMYNFYRNITKTQAESNLWTVFTTNELVAYMTDKQGAQWQMSKRCDKEELKEVLSQHPYSKIGKETILEDGTEESQKRKCFVPLNCKGTNIYGDRTALAYMVNLNLNPATKLFFHATIDRAPLDEVFALNMMTQWLFRGAVRNGQPITVYVPSKRMRHLLLTWLGYTKEELF